MESREEEGEKRAGEKEEEMSSGQQGGTWSARERAGACEKEKRTQGTASPTTHRSCGDARRRLGME